MPSKMPAPQVVALKGQYDYQHRSYGDDIVITASLLGETSTHISRHNHIGSFFESGNRCSACRWLTISIYRIVSDDGVTPPPHRYLVYTVGHSSLPGEIDRPNAQFTNSAYEIVEILTVRKQGPARLPAPSARVIAQAAQYDDDIYDAYVSRVVA